MMTRQPSAGVVEERAEYWRAHIRACRHSGLTVEDYCAKEGFSPSTLYRWRRALNARMETFRRSVRAPRRPAPGPR